MPARDAEAVRDAFRGAAPSRASLFHACIGAIALVIALSACATVPYGFRKNPLSVMGDGADAWIIVPVARHRALVERVASVKGFTVSEAALDRTSVLYVGLYPAGTTETAEATGTAGDVRLLATGSFPKGASSVVFPKSRGWERAGTESGVTWYRSGPMGAAIPRSGLFAMSRDMPALLSNLSSPDVAPAAIPEELESYLESPALDGRVAFMTASPASVLSGLLPSGMTVPVEYALFFAGKNEGGIPEARGGYTLTGYLQAKDERSTRAVAAMIRMATGARPRVSGSRVYVEDWAVDCDTLAAFAGL